MKKVCLPLSSAYMHILCVYTRIRYDCNSKLRPIEYTAYVSIYEYN